VHIVQLLSVPRLGAHPPLSSFQPGQLERSEEVICSHIVVSFCRQANSMVKKSRLELLSGHSGKCILFNCCLFPVLGLTLLTLLYTWPVGAERGGYLLTYCFLILQAGISTVKCLSSGRRAEVGDV
jgi:hypothetical protein